MADDKIDIEEHDILDSPYIRRMFPDISVLKKEVIDDHDEVLIKETPANSIVQQKTENCLAVVMNNNVKTNLYCSGKHKVFDAKLTASKFIDHVETDKSPTIVIDETDVTMPSFISKTAHQDFGVMFTESICMPLNDAEKFPTIEIDEMNGSLSDPSNKPTDEAIVTRFSINQFKEINKVEYPTIVIDDDNVTLPCVSNKSAGQASGRKFSESNCKQTNDSEKYPTIDIDETNLPWDSCEYPTIVIDETIEAISRPTSKLTDQVIDTKLLDYKFKDIEKTQKYLTMVLDEANVALPSYSGEPEDQAFGKKPLSNQNYTHNNRFDNKIEVKKCVKTTQETSKATGIIRKETIEKRQSGSFLLNSKVISEETVYKSNVTILNQNTNLSQLSKQGENRIPSTVISNELSRSHNADDSTLEKGGWKGNKIILGSKLSTINSKSKVCGKHKHNVSSNVRVLLENLGTFLSKSSRYCKTCLILFPSNKTLADHRTLIHSHSENNELSKSNKIIRNIKRLVNINNKYRCSVCSTVYASASNLLRHKRCVHSLQIKKRKRRPNINHNIPPPPHGKINAETNLKCKHCNKKFSSQQVLIDHMYNILQSKTNNNVKNSIKNDNFDRKKMNKISRIFYRCPFCSSYFKQKITYVKHLKNKHKKTDNIKLNKVAFDPVCKYCSNKYYNVQSFNGHVRKSHQKLLNLSKYLPKKKIQNSIKIPKYKEQTQSKMYSNTNDRGKDQVYHEASKDEKKCEEYLLKTVFFKCDKCNVCFLSGKEAANHIKHENTISWECTKCSYMFKREEQNRHAQQHLYCDSFEVFKICENTYAFLLFKCPNCTTYFCEKDFFYHYSMCEIQSPDSAYCKTCHILIDNKIKEVHDIHHKMVGGKELSNILVETDIITRNDEKVKQSIDTNKKLRDKESIFITDDRTDEENHEEFNTTPKGLEANGSVKLVVNSDVYINNAERHNINIKTEFSAKQKTQEMIEKSIRFMYCDTCKTFIFVNRVRKLYNHLKGRCLNRTNYVCKYCGLMLSNKTIDSHRKLHQNVPSLTLSDFIFHDLNNGNQICPPVPKYPNCPLCEKHFITKTAIISHICSEDYLKCPLCNIKLSKAAFPLHLSFHNYLPKNKSERSLVDVSVHKKDSQPTSINKLTNLFDSDKNYEDRCLLVYICKICKVTVDTYDRVIEHCHYHINSQENGIITKPCDLCNLIFDDICFDKHKMLHSFSQNKKFSVLTYDAFYVTAEDKVWLNHLFGSISKKEIDNILKDSIYNFERKIKMHVLQDGLPDLTFYKCAKCNSFVNPSSLYDHCAKDILCYTSKVVPCRVCGVLMSEAFLIQHEKMHETLNVTVRSYRIVLFNCDDDEIINHSLSVPRRYVLYECRNCNGIVDKKQFEYHRCDFGDLSKCSHCGLLLYNNDYMPHVVKHKEFCSFTESNIIIIMIGAVKDEVLKNRYRPSFRGLKLDYSLYKCNKCDICHKDKQSSLTHNCAKDVAKTKCLSCDLYFEDSFFKNHRKLHEYDIFFSKEKLMVFELNCSRPRSDEHIIVIEDEEDLQSVHCDAITDDKLNNTNNSIGNNLSAKTIVEKYDEIFKCPCGLHFLTEESASLHYNLTKCNNRRSRRQTCTKCGLTFKPNILYSHLLKHHGNKKVSYTFNITSISK